MTWRDWAREAPQRVRESFRSNPLAWFLFGLLLLVEWWNYEKGRDIHRLCDLVAPHIMTVPDKYATTVGQKVDNICGRYDESPD
jgi:hypothetical protein